MMGAMSRASMVPRNSVGPPRATCTITPVAAPQLSTAASPITAYVTMMATSSPSTAVMSLVPLHEAAVVGVCAMVAMVAAAVIGPVHKVLHCRLTLRVNSAEATTAAVRWLLPHKNKPHLQVSA